jgi:uncharacterized surface protein with fasciclin (FAS1) repeats
MRKALILGVAAIGLAALPPANSASASGGGNGPTLAEILLADAASDGPDGFDRRRWDYDIVTQAVLLFPDLVAAASDPSAQLTVFLPNDQAFRQLVREVTGTAPRSEAEVFAAVASLGTDTVLRVLQYHILPGAISYWAALGADGEALATLLPDAAITVDVDGPWWWRYVRLGDLDADDRDAVVVHPSVGGEAANGYAHGIDRVLRPIDLP